MEEIHYHTVNELLHHDVVRKILMKCGV